MTVGFWARGFIELQPPREMGAVGATRPVSVVEAGVPSFHDTYPTRAAQRKRLWATATRSMTVVTLASPRTVN